MIINILIVPFTLLFYPPISTMELPYLQELPVQKLLQAKQPHIQYLLIKPDTSSETENAIISKISSISDADG